MRILLISHEASRTGAPRVAALVARCLVAQGHTVHIVSRTGGPLLTDFAAETATSVEFLHRVRRRVRAIPTLSRFSRLLDSAIAAATILAHRARVVYVNSSAASVYLAPARALRRTTFLHVHESGEVASAFLRAQRAEGELDGVRLIACSPSVRRELAVVADRPVETIDLLPSVPDDSRVRAQAEQPLDLNLNDDELIVGCCGSAEHRKGADLWGAIADEVRRAIPQRRVRFVWVGDVSDSMRFDVDQRVEFVGPRENPYPLMRRFDLAALPSRDDPFPLVVLEAMLLGKPVVAFNVGAVADQIGPAGIVVPPGDVAAFGHALVELLVDDERRRTLGQDARQRAEDIFSTEAFTRELALTIRT